MALMPTLSTARSWGLGRIMTNDAGIAFNQGVCGTQETGGSDHNPYDRVWQSALWGAYEQGRIEGKWESAQMESRVSAGQWCGWGERPIPDTWPNNETPGAKDVEDTCRYLRQAVDRLVSSTQWSRQEAQAWIEQVARANKASLRQVAEAIVTQRTVRYHYDVPI